MHSKSCEPLVVVIGSAFIGLVTFINLVKTINISLVLGIHVFQHLERVGIKVTRWRKYCPTL